MARANRWHLALIVLIMSAAACAESGSKPVEVVELTSIPTPSDPLPKGDRILELDVNPPENGDYDRAVEMARELGAESIRLSIYWDEIEIAPGVYDPDPNWLTIANQYYPARDMSISLTISVLDTTEIRLPADLKAKSLSDPAVIERFNNFLDYIYTQTTDLDIVYLAIGNEIDGVLGDHAQDWEDYTIFFQNSAIHTKKIWPELPVSTKVTFDTFFDQAAPYAKDIYRGSEWVMTTYYPLQGDFSVKDPKIVLEDFDQLVLLFPDQEILITEIGFPSSLKNGSSQEKQAEFIHYAFQAWDQHRDQISLLSYSWLSDLPPGAVQELESYYGLKNQGFAEFLRTLGLRTYPGAGENKPGYGIFQKETSLRGW